MTPGAGLPGADVLKATLPASLDKVETFISSMRQFLSQRGLASIVFDLELLARETLVNAIRHGCQEDPSLSVNVELTIQPGRVRLCVSDCGRGFDWRSASSALPSPVSEKGRGLCILKNYADDVEFNESGNTVCLIKTVPLEEDQMSKDKQGLVQITLEANVSALSAPSLREMFLARVQDGAQNLELDLARVESIDSVGIGLLVATHNTLAKLGGSLSLVNVGADIYQLLTLMRLDKHFTISPA